MQTVPAQTVILAEAEMRLNTVYLWMIALTAALGGLLFGYDWVVIGGAKPFYEQYFGLSGAGEIGWAMSCALVGCLAGAMLSGALSDRFGRKRLLFLAALLFVVTSIGTGLAHSFPQFVFWRIWGGVAIGLASNLSPMYIAEIAPAALRGRLVSLNQLTIVIGILLAQLVNWLLAEKVPVGASTEEIVNSWNGQQGWRWMFAMTAIPAGLFWAGLFFVPESPRWLAKKGIPDKAQEILARIGGAAYARLAMDEINASLAGEMGKVDFGELFDPRLRRPLTLGIVLAILSQWCGINSIFNYAEEIFSAAGYEVSGLLFNILITGLVNLVFTLAALRLVDRLGRRPLMLIGTAGLAMIFILMGCSYQFGLRGWPVLMLVLAAIACFACTLAPITWVVIAEIFPNRIRGAAMSVAVFALWSGCFSLTYLFPLLNARLGAAGTFWFYAAICVVGFSYLWRRLPETKGKTLEAIEREMAG